MLKHLLMLLLQNVQLHRFFIFFDFIDLI